MNGLRNSRGVSTVEVLLITAALVSVALIFKGALLGFVDRSLPELFGGVRPEIKEGIFMELVGPSKQGNVPAPPGYMPPKAAAPGVVGRYAMNYAPAYFSQSDPKWGSKPYTVVKDSSQTIANSGCGPTTMAMVISSLTGKPVTPADMAEYALKTGARTADKGTSWSFFGTAANKYGLKCVQVRNYDIVKATLGDGNHMVIASMKPGHFTSQGHYVTLCGVGGRAGHDWFYVQDPNKNNKSYGNDQRIEQGEKGDGIVEVREDLLKEEAGQFWIVSKE